MFLTLNLSLFPRPSRVASLLGLARPFPTCASISAVINSTALVLGDRRLTDQVVLIRVSGVSVAAHFFRGAARSGLASQAATKNGIGIAILLLVMDSPSDARFELVSDNELSNYDLRIFWVTNIFSS